jgi:hypothetical protein
MAEPSPIGIATKIAIPVIRKVPFSSCQIPNDGGLNSGAQSVNAKKSAPTSRKNGIDSSTRAKTIPNVVRIEIAAARKSSARIASSPQRRLATPRGRAPGVAPVTWVPASIRSGCAG